ncbi:hypothetical protein GFJ94_02460 [Flavobacterium sp. LMO8]|uniref:hypothetical protein n=1 Tax=Flavobacterium sp. LMO8 TaxID=2654244 RepID=UPI001291A3A7|nr:hypothetical protein [Flavobacterium sp. LMO8]MQP23924.1 hypothetical protein [Flavobacterium sp. LMO8]
MKAVFTILATFLITITSCNCQKDTASTNVTSSGTKMQNEMPIIKYEANARGLALAVKVENQVVSISRVRNFKDYEEKIKISDSDWKEIVILTKAVDLAKVKDLKWPTEKRYYDGAAHANITFISDGVEYPANGFDHGFPPVEIEKLVNKILKLTEK